MKTIIGELEYITGHLRYGHYELELSNEDYERFIELSLKEQEEYITDNGTLVIDDYYLSDCGPISDIKIYNN